ncbi:GNAT family N-acetyltransferase [Pseudonocardia xinjiangensis]|uniref:GNAT family N-acetyltransferase n=1 Tax=Pseudonocardia xinjiangensis TaxID=75289 RepID=UPI003D8A4B30
MLDPSGLVFRPLLHDDIGSATDLLMLGSPSGVRYHLAVQLAAAEAGERGCAFVAEWEGSIVGSALLSDDPLLPGLVSTLVAVAEPARKSGVGSALADLLGEQLQHEALPAYCKLPDDQFEGRRFAERRGFVLCGHSLGWSLDLTARDGTLERAAREAARSADVRIRQADMRKELDTVLECALRCMPGMPSEQHVAPEKARKYLPDDAIVLLAEREVPGQGQGPRAIGLTALSPRIETAAWYTLFTGVAPAHRRSGVARALKTESFLRARHARAQSVVTHNHDTNDAIIGLNTSFGMQPAPGYWDLRQPRPA